MCVIRVTGQQVLDALHAPACPGKPRLIWLHTVKGKGVSFMEDQAGWHGKAPNDEETERALAELAAARAELNGVK